MLEPLISRTRLSSQRPRKCCWTYYLKMRCILPQGDNLDNRDNKNLSKIKTTPQKTETKLFTSFEICWELRRGFRLTNRNDQEADVAQPVRCLVGKLLHEAPEHSAQVTLVSRHSHLNGGRCLCIAVTAEERWKAHKNTDQTLSFVQQVIYIFYEMAVAAVW